MKVVYCVHSLHTAGGMEKVISFKANWLAEKYGHEVHIVTAHLHGRKPYFPLSPKVRVVDLGINDRTGGARYVRALDKTLRLIEPDVLVSTGGSDVFHILRCRYSCARVVEYHFSHDKFIHKYGDNLLSRFRTERLHRAMMSYDAIVALSSYDEEYFKGLPYAAGKRIIQIYNPVDMKVDELAALEARRFLAVGRLSPEKNFEEALRVWSLVVSRHPDWRLDIYGEGRMRERLEELVESMGLGGKVYLRGNSRRLKDEYLSASGILLTSRYEGLGLVLMEAAVAGLPSVANDCPGGVGEIVEDGGSGFLTACGDTRAMADRVCGLIESFELRRRMGARAAELASAYGPEVIMSRWDELFRELTAQKRT